MQRWIATKIRGGVHQRKPGAPYEFMTAHGQMIFYSPQILKAIHADGIFNFYIQETDGLWTVRGVRSFDIDTATQGPITWDSLWRKQNGK